MKESTKIKQKKFIKAILKFIAFLLIFVIAIWLSKIAKDSLILQNWIASFGYSAIFFISTLSGFNLVVPIPAISFLPLFIESGLNFWLTIVLITLGMSLADSLAYLLGRAGREITWSLTQSRIFDKLEKWCDRNFWGPIIVFGLYVALAPLPNEVIIIPLAVLGYRWRHLILPLLIGNFIFNILAAFGITKFF